MNDAYSPHTLEHIDTDAPAPWMGRAGVECPAYDQAAQSAFWRGGPTWSVEDAAPAPGRTVLSSREYLGRFSDIEYAAVKASTNVTLQRAYDSLVAAQFVDLEDPDVGAGLDLMIYEGIIDANRKSALLAPVPV